MKAILFALLACTLSAAQQPPSFRLSSDAVPTRYRLNLTLDPEKTDYSGDVEIDLDVRKATSVLWLNASKLNVSGAFIEGAVRATAQIVPGGDDFVGFAFDHPLTPGPVRLAVHFSAKVNTTSGAGVFLSKRNQDRYLFTQFEPIDARAAFPCFDEPAYKVPWQITLHIPQKDIAVANTNIQSEQSEGALKKVVFRETKPLPSYLVAFAVGPLEFRGRREGGPGSGTGSHRCSTR